MIQVNCTHCSKIYQFDPSSIPAEGYDAQCVDCNNTFFVDPNHAQAVPSAILSAEVEPSQTQTLVTVSCSACDKSYSFPPDSIPAEGYNAQCTKCQAVFFVALPQAQAQAQAQELSQEPAAPVQSVKANTNPLLKKLGVEEQGEDLFSLSLVNRVENNSKGSDLISGSDDDDDSVMELVSMAASMGVPHDAPEGATMENDFYKLIMRKKQRRLMFVGALAAISFSLLGLRFILPGAWDASVGPIFGIKARIVPAAIPLAKEGLRLMLEDTQESYAKAIDKLHAALKLDPLYPDAEALLTIVHSFRGADIKAQGKSMRLQAEALVAEITALEAQKRPPKNLEKQLSAKRKRIGDINRKAMKTLDQGGDHLQQASKRLQKLRKHAGDNKLVVEASGFMFAADPERISKAAGRVDRALLLYKQKKLDLNNLPDRWIGLLHAIVQRASSGHSAIPILDAVLKKEPAMMRAQYIAANIEYTEKNYDNALKRLKLLLQNTPSHTRAMSLRETIEKAVITDTLQSQKVGRKLPNKKAGKSQKRLRKR